MGIIVVLIGLALGVGLITNILQVLAGVAVYAFLLYISKDDIFEFLFNQIKELFLKKRKTSQ